MGRPLVSNQRIRVRNHHVCSLWKLSWTQHPAFVLLELEMDDMVRETWCCLNPALAPHRVHSVRDAAAIEEGSVGVFPSFPSARVHRVSMMSVHYASVASSRHPSGANFNHASPKQQHCQTFGGDSRTAHTKTVQDVKDSRQCFHDEWQ
jgi:hypothetical protein